MPALVSRGRGRRTINEINMVPFIDVMLVLLIIFMVTAPLISPSVIDLPSVGKANKTPDNVIRIVVNKDESLAMSVTPLSTKASATAASVSEVPLALNDIAKAVLQAQHGVAATPVVISANRSVKYEIVVKLMDTLQRAGVQRVGLSVQLAP
jgi:biopolymer transport protein TolR